MITVDLGYRPRPWQHAVHLGMARKRWGVIVCHRRAGKSVLAVMQLIDRACRCERPNGRYAYIAPFLKQAKAIAWTYLKQYALKIPGTVVNEGELRVTLPNGAEIRIYGADNADSLRGIYLDGVVLDEVSQLSQELWDSVLRPALADRGGWALLMGTPAGINLLSELFFKARNNEQWYSGLYGCYDTQALPDAEVADLKADMTESAFAREFLCDFNASVDNVLLSVDEVETACRRAPKEGDYGHAAKIIGVDVARQGGDATVIIRRQGLIAWEPIVMRGADAMSVADRIAYEMNEWNPDGVLIDGTGGYGAGVIDRLRQLGHRPLEVQFAGKPSDARYLNKRMEMWWDMCEWVKRSGALPPACTQLRLDLCTPTYGFNDAGKMLLESKEKIKERGMPSSDYADALACTFAEKIIPSQLFDDLHAGAFHIPRRQFDPLGRVGKYGR